MTERRAFGIMAILLLGSASGLSAQMYGDDTALVGVDSVRLSVNLTFDDAIPVMPRLTYVQGLTDAFESSVRSSGVRVVGSSADELVCSVAILWQPDSSYEGGGFAGSSVVVGFRVPVTVGATHEDRYAETWGMRSVGMVSGVNFDPAVNGRFCAQQFRVAWLRANPS